MPKDMRLILLAAALLFVGSCGYQMSGPPPNNLQRYAYSHLSSLEREITTVADEEKKARMTHALSQARLLLAGEAGAWERRNRVLLITGGILVFGVLAATIGLDPTLWFKSKAVSPLPPQERKDPTIR